MILQFPTHRAALPLALIEQAIPKLSRHDLEGLTERLIDRLDQIDGDPDAEDATDLEDDFGLSPVGRYFADDRAGCPISDPGGQCDEDEINTDLGIARGHAVGCPISDPGGCEHDGREVEDGY